MKYIILLACIAVQVCLGGLYAWSTFTPALIENHGLTNAQCSIIFGTLIAVFTITMVFAGRMLEARGPRILLILSGLLFGLGYFIASHSGGSFWMLLFALGGVVGVASGLGYVCPLSVGMKWFPDHKGLVTGIAVGGFGGGAVVLTNWATAAMGGGVEVLAFFKQFGLVYAAVIVVAGSMVTVPAKTKAKSTPTLSSNTLVRDPYFWALVCAMLAGSFAGLLVIGNLKPMAMASGITSAQAALGISAFAVGNAAGRVTWGKVVDSLERKTIHVSLAVLAIALIALPLMVSQVSTFIIVAFLIGFGFGACFVIHATLVAARWGEGNLGNVYPLVFLAYGVAGITGPSLGGWLYDVTNSFAIPIAVSIACVLVGLGVSSALMRRSGVVQTVENPVRVIGTPATLAVKTPR